MWSGVQVDEWASLIDNERGFLVWFIGRRWCYALLSSWGRRSVYQDVTSLIWFGFDVNLFVEWKGRALVRVDARLVASPWYRL